MQIFLSATYWTNIYGERRIAVRGWFSTVFNWTKCPHNRGRQRFNWLLQRHDRRSRRTRRVENTLSNQDQVSLRIELTRRRQQLRTKPENTLHQIRNLHKHRLWRLHVDQALGCRLGFLEGKMPKPSETQQTAVYCKRRAEPHRLRAVRHTGSGSQLVFVHVRRGPYLHGHNSVHRAHSTHTKRKSTRLSMCTSWHTTTRSA